MAKRVYWNTNTIPANTLTTSLFTRDMSFTAANVEHITIIVPPGPAGAVGFQILSGGGVWLPQTPGQFIVADGHIFEFPQDQAPNNGSWKFTGYNLDFFAHTIQVGFHITDFVASAVPTSALVGV